MGWKLKPRGAWRASHGAIQPSCSTLPSLGIHHPASLAAARGAQLPRTPLTEPERPLNLAAVKRQGEQASSHILKRGARGEVKKEPSGRAPPFLHLQKRPEGKSVKTPLAALQKQKYKGKRFLANSDSVASSLRSKELERPGHRRAWSQYNFLTETDAVFFF